MLGISNSRPLFPSESSSVSISEWLEEVILTSWCSVCRKAGILMSSSVRVKDSSPRLWKVYDSVKSYCTGSTVSALVGTRFCNISRMKNYSGWKGVYE